MIFHLIIDTLVQDMAFDTVERWIYFTDIDSDIIYKIRPNGAELTTVLNVSHPVHDAHPAGIVLHVESRYRSTSVRIHAALNLND